MLFAYLDEFGHVGNFVARTDPKHNVSPVFGMAGILLPEAAVRPFATKFLQLKAHTLKADIEKARKIPQKWEKKGSDIFRPAALERYPEIRHLGFRLLTAVQNCGGKVFYHGREKRFGDRKNVNPNGLYTTVFSHAIRQIDAYRTTTNQNFALVVDEHSARKELLECAAKTMYGRDPTKKLVSPPFEVESYLNQNMQAADWVAAIVGRIWNYKILPDQYEDHEMINLYFDARISRLVTHSKVQRRRELDGTAKKPYLVEVNSMSEKISTLRYSIADSPKGKSSRK